MTLTMLHASNQKTLTETDGERVREVTNQNMRVKKSGSDRVKKIKYNSLQL